MVRAALAAIAGCAAIAILAVFTDQILTLMSQGFSPRAAPVHVSSFTFALGLIRASFHSFLAGYLCASLAQQNSSLATLFLIVGGESMGIVAAIRYRRATPHWFTLGLLVIFPVCARAGAQFLQRREGPLLRFEGGRRSEQTAQRG
jgi:hypothetical protein